MKSLRAKITILMMAAILSCVLAIGGISILSIRQNGNENTDTQMSMLCQNVQKTIDGSLRSIQHAVYVASSIVMDELDHLPLDREQSRVHEIGNEHGTDETIIEVDLLNVDQEVLDRALTQHIEKVSTLFEGIAKHTNGVLTYYYRIAPEISTKVQGFWAQQQADGTFAPNKVTDVTQYAEDDIEHVGWYYVPKAYGEEMWMQPYYNDNIGKKIISYVIPIFKGDTFFGVIGMDVDFNTLTAVVDANKIFDTGYAFVVDAEGTAIYHPLIGENVSPEFISEGRDVLDSSLKIGMEENITLVSYDYNGIIKRATYTTLSDGNYLMVTAPEREIQKTWLRLTERIFFASIFILVAFNILTSIIVGRITAPLNRLIDAARQVDQGNYEISLKCTNKDEVGMLTSVFLQLVSHLKVYIQDINSKVYKDALTGVKNKAAYDMKVKELNEGNGADSNGRMYVIAMFDCNNLKRINDQYGHEKGDIYIKNACNCICRVFAHSPVFRVGGDEFICVLEGEDYFRAEDYLHMFVQECMDHNEHVDKPWEKISVAAGMACYDPCKDRKAEDVQRRADAGMYDNKRSMKNARTSE